MTCIVGVECEDGSAWLGGDRYFGDKRWNDTLANPKIVRRGDVLLGFCGGMREGQILERAEKPRKRLRGENVESYVIEAVAGPMLLLHKRAGVEVTEGFEGLVACSGQLFALDGEGGVWRSRNGYQAIGSAGSFALGSLASTAGEAPQVRLEKALAAAAKHSPNCLPPFDLLRLPR